MNSSTDHARRNVALLAACQAMLFTNNSTLIAINGLAGLALAPYKGLATLPITFWLLGGAIATMPASLHMKRVRRQRGLTAGNLSGEVCALFRARAVLAQAFLLPWLRALGWAHSHACGQA